MRVIPVPQLMDNYAYLIVDEATSNAAIVDCAEAEKVLAAARSEGVTLTAILPTHHHFDHVGGNEDLLRALPGLRVYGYRGEEQRVPGCNAAVAEGDEISVGSLRARILFIPAHTSGHIAYYFEREKAVFTGDTLFAAGCGRLFEGDAPQMMSSLSKLLALPDDTRVYFGHEYTEKNLRFALSLEPECRAIQDKHRWSQETTAGGGFTTPTTIASEKDTNPFFRWSSAELRASVERSTGRHGMSDVEIFAATRALKDNF